MRTGHRAARDRRIIVVVLVASAAVSAVFGYLAASPSTSRIVSSLLGVANALTVATPIVLFEIYRTHWAFGRRMLRLPLLAYLAFKNVYYLACIVGGTVLVRVVFNNIIGRPVELDQIMVNSFVFGAVMVFIGTFAFEMGRLLGWVTLKNLLTGRYVQPRREQRAFLLIDMKDSTGLAERLGPIRFHELLNAFFRDISDAAFETRAEIHKYVGDEAILTWSADKAVADRNCLAYPFIARDIIAANGKSYRRRFGAVPEFRASLHCGEIVAGEIGDLRREIAYVGDTLNVAARLLEATKARGRDILVSSDLLKSMMLPADLRAEPLPTLAIRGRMAPLEIFALERVP